MMARGALRNIAAASMALVLLAQSCHGLADAGSAAEGGASRGSSCGVGSGASCSSGQGAPGLLLLQKQYSASIEHGRSQGERETSVQGQWPWAPPSQPGAVAPPATGVDVPVKLATFNVYYKALETPERVDGISTALANISADIAVVTESWSWNGKAQILAEVRRKTNRNYVFCNGGDFQDKAWDGDILFDADLWQSLRDGVEDMGEERGLSWALLQHKASERKLFVYGAHPLCCGHEEAHLQNAEAFAEHLQAQPERPEAPAVLMGDFNAHEDWSSIRFYRGEYVWASNRWWKLPISFEDAFRVPESNRYIDAHTYQTGVRFDYIFTERRDPPAFTTTSASIWREAPGESDHYPLVADVVLRR